MGKATCNWRNCELPTHSCGMCGTHYKAARDPSAKHKLKYKDSAGTRAHCSTCGPIKLRLLPNGNTQCINLLYERPYARKMQEQTNQNPKPFHGGYGENAARAGYLRRKYDLTIEQWEAMVVAQGGLCAICGKTSVRPLVVDHSHVTGKVRALLCTACNTGLGLLGDDPTRLVSAAMYIQAHA